MIITNNYETLKQTCSIHGEYTALKYYLTDRIYITRCPICTEQEREQQAAADIRAYVQERERANQEALMKTAGIPSIHQESNLDNFQVITEGQSAVYRLSTDFVNGRLNNLVLIGQTGVGKTHILCGILRSCASKGLSVCYTTESKILRDFKETFRKSSTKTEQAIIDYYSAFEILAIDEIRGSSWKDYDGVTLGDIIDKRYCDARRTIYAGNVNADQMRDHFDDKTLSRIRAGGVVYAITGEDWRRKSSVVGHDVSRGCIQPLTLGARK